MVAVVAMELLLLLPLLFAMVVVMPLVGVVTVVASVPSVQERAGLMSSVGWRFVLASVTGSGAGSNSERFRLPPAAP